MDVTLSNACANDVLMRHTTVSTRGTTVKRVPRHPTMTLAAPGFFSLNVGITCSFGLCGTTMLRLGNNIRGVFRTCRGSFSHKTGHSSGCVCNPTAPEDCFTKIGVACWMRFFQRYFPYERICQVVRHVFIRLECVCRVFFVL